MIRSSKHTIKLANRNKQLQLRSFLKEYRRVAKIILDYLWDRPYTFGNKTLDISNQFYQVPKFISTINLNLNTTLSARALKCCSTQVCGMIRAVLEKPRKRLYMLKKLKKENKPTKKLERKIARQKITKPYTGNIKAELNSICCDYQTTNDRFDGFLQLKSIGKAYGKIRLPINFHRHSNKLKRKGQLLNSFLISDTSVDFRWQLPNKPAKRKGETLGADQGYKDLLTFSNGAVTNKTNSHNHSLETITKTLARKRKGSKSFKRTQEHRLNFINWSINQLNFKGIKEIKLEKIVNIRYRRKSSRLMSHWCNPLIRDKLKSKCEEEQVVFTLQPSAYRSQRCYSCGWVCKASRKGKLFKCLKCGYESDSDLNAAKNLKLNLPDATALRNQKLNLQGFFWTFKGFSFDGEEFTVSLSQKET